MKSEFTDQLFVRFECGQEDRISKDFGPFEWVQLTYDTLRVAPDGETMLADFIDGWWVTSDGTKWSDVIVGTTREVIS